MELSKEKFTPPSDKSFLFLGLEHIEKNTRKIISVGCSKNIRSTKNIFKSQDILYGKLRPYLNKTWMAKFYDILVFNSSKFITANFVSYALKIDSWVTNHIFKKFQNMNFILLKNKNVLLSKLKIWCSDAAQKELKHLEMIYKTVPDCICRNNLPIKMKLCSMIKF